jgi:hypothetical protein
MEAKPANPHRMLPLKLAAVLLFVFLLMSAVAPTEGRVTGTWVSDSDSGLVVLDVRRDGTFVQYDQGQQISKGRWRLDKNYQVFRSLELFDSYRLPVGLEDLHRGKGAMVYPLAHKEGKLCLETGQDSVYWCKAK